MAAITTSDIKKIIQDAMTDYLSTTGKYIIEGIIRDTIKENVILNTNDSGYNPLIEAQQVIGGTNIYSKPSINQEYGYSNNTQYNMQHTQKITQQNTDNKPKHRFSSILEQTMRSAGDLSNFADTRDNMV
jgi:hypothetical protein